MSFVVGLATILFIIYWWLLSKLVDEILEVPRLKQAHWFLVGIINAIIVFYTATASNNVIYAYLVMVVLMLAEFLIFYKDNISSIIFCTLACQIHVLVAIMITASVLVITTNYRSVVILSSSKVLTPVLLITFALLDIAILAVMKFVPLRMVKLITQHEEQQFFIIAWMAGNSIFLYYMASSFSQPGYPTGLAGNQAWIAIASIVGLYLVLFFSIKTCTVLGYKEKNEALLQAIHQEQQYRNSMVKDALVSYEVNVTQDLIIKGFEDERKALGSKALRYSDMLNLMARKIIHPKDVGEFMQRHKLEHVIERFKNGDSVIVAEYRRRLDNGDYAWVRAMVNLVEDIENEDIKAFVCIKNIDIEKKSQLELQRLAERDPLTGLYNKNMTGKLIDEHLISGQSLINSACFMIDVDDFKEINDHLGHVYGDAVLCELGEKLVQIFRGNDIVGRIGGDEFIVFLKNGALAQTVEEKAKAICKAFYITYKGLNGEGYTISSSIGISFSPKDGSNFKDLYSHADIALYAAKNGGKNTYKVYNGSSFTGYTSQRTEIQSIGNLSQKEFRLNRIEYVFKMLYHSENPVTAIHSALELLASHFSFERGYIFETSKDGKTTSNTFEWCAKGITPQIDNLQKIPIEAVATANSHFKKNGTFALKSLDDLQPIERAVLEPQGIKSMFQFGIFDKNNLLGFIGFDNCISEMIPSDTEIDEMETICNILATFFVKQHVDEVAAKDLLARQEVMNHLDSYIYVIRPDTFEVLFMNDKIQKLMKEARSTTFCYSFFRGNLEQCEDCPIRRLGDNKMDRVICEMYNEKLHIWMEATASTLRWTDGRLACLINCADITRQKEARQQHIQQLENLAYVDELTGCRTYHKFKEDAKCILENHQDVPHFLVKLDIDNFKLINQIYGYEKGNEVLCCVAKAIEKTARNENEIFARVTNDEFLALFTLQAEKDMEELYKIFLQHFYTSVENGFSFKFNFSHGRYLIYPNNTRKLDVNDMFEKANVAHKAAKLNKALEFVCYDERMTKDALHVKEIEDKMAGALENDEFIVYLQPKYYLSNDTIGGAEALARWENTNSELFLPSAFISVFEQNGFIIKLDFYIFRKACNIIKTWIEAGLEPIVVSVNFSRLHLGNVNFVKELCDIVDSTGIHRKYLEIEIMETVIYDNIDTLEVLLDDVHRNGFSMSMDDFGSGYSSLGMLKNFPVDVIKLDRSFFANQRDVERSKTVVGSVIQMAAGLGIRTVAEGVEEQAHIDFLREINCDMVQGYYYAKPMAVETFTKLMRKQKGE